MSDKKCKIQRDAEDLTIKWQISKNRKNHVDHDIDVKDPQKVFRTSQGFWSSDEGADADEKPSRKAEKRYRIIGKSRRDIKPHQGQRHA